MLSQIARNVARASTRLVLTRQMSSNLPRMLFASNSQVLNTNYVLNKTSLRWYADEAKFDKAQIEQKVLDIIKNFDRVKENPAKPQVSLESNLMKDLGLDSLDQVEIIVQLEDTFGYEIPDSDYEKLNTPSEIVKYIQKRLAEV